MPKLRLTPKLLIALFCLCAGLVLAQAFALRFSFERRFSVYVRGVEVNRLNVLAGRLARYYGEQGSWNTLRDNSRLWSRLTGDSVQVHGAQPGTATLYTLVDEKSVVVIGSEKQSPRAQSVPVMWNGNTVGVLSGAPLQRLMSVADVRFQHDMVKGLWLISTLSLLLGGMAAFFIARNVLDPVLQISSAARALRAGRFEPPLNLRRSDELGELASDFNSLSETLAANEDSRRQFMADLSHEMRTPLAVLQGMLEAIEDQIVDPSPERIKSLQAEVALLARLANDMGQLAHVQTAALTFNMQRLDICVVLAHSARAMADILRDRGMGIELSTPDRPLLILGDEMRIIQMISNLLENAARYASAGERLVLSAAVTSSGEVLVSVRDFGPGVSEAAATRLFDRFFREESSRNRSTGGMGLGLTICREIAATHKGFIIAKNEPSGGLSIEVTFPPFEEVQQDA
ncbi:MAG: ATP-binding protein [Acidobacteriota bacterium]